MKRKQQNVWITIKNNSIITIKQNHFRITNHKTVPYVLYYVCKLLNGSVCIPGSQQKRNWSKNQSHLEQCLNIVSIYENVKQQIRWNNVHTLKFEINQILQKKGDLPCWSTIMEESRKINVTGSQARKRTLTSSVLFQVLVTMVTFHSLKKSTVFGL